MTPRETMAVMLKALGTGFVVDAQACGESDADCVGGCKGLEPKHRHDCKLGEALRTAEAFESQAAAMDKNARIVELAAALDQARRELSLECHRGARHKDGTRCTFKTAQECGRAHVYPWMRDA